MSWKAATIMTAMQSAVRARPVEHLRADHEWAMQWLAKRLDIPRDDLTKDILMDELIDPASTKAGRLMMAIEDEFPGLQLLEDNPVQMDELLTGTVGDYVDFMCECLDFYDADRFLARAEKSGILVNRGLNLG